MTRKEAIGMWKTIVHDNGSDIDPENGMNWRDMAIGFMLALGFSIDEAKDIHRELVKRGIY